MMEQVTKPKHAPQVASSFTGELATPIPVVLSGDSEADDAAIRRAFSATQDKLPALADHLGVKLDSVDAFKSLCSPMVMALARATVPGFQVKVKKSAGAKREKTGQYYLMLAVAYEMFREKNAEAVTKSAFARTLAEHQMKRKGRGRRSETAIAALAEQFRQDISKATPDALVPVTREIMRLSRERKTSDEICQYLESLT